MQPQPGESAHGWVVRTLHNVPRAEIGKVEHFIDVLPGRFRLLFRIYPEETVGSLKARFFMSTKMLGIAEVEDLRLIYAGKALAETCKLSAYHVFDGGVIHAVPASRRRRARTAVPVRYSR